MVEVLDGGQCSTGGSRFRASACSVSRESRHRGSPAHPPAGCPMGLSRIEEMSRMDQRLACDSAGIGRCSECFAISIMTGRHVLTSTSRAPRRSIDEQGAPILVGDVLEVSWITVTESVFKKTEHASFLQFQPFPPYYLARARSCGCCANSRDLEVSSNVEPGPDSAPAWRKAE